MGRGLGALLVRGALGASAGGAVWYLSLPLAGTYVLFLLPLPFNFLAFPVLIMLFVVPPASIVGAAGASAVWLLERKRGACVGVWLRAAITTAVSAAVAVPLAVQLMPRPYELTPEGRLGYSLLCGVLVGVGAGLATGGKSVKPPVNSP